MGYTPRVHHPTLRFESALVRAGNGPVAGIDEAGRGPLAGPVVAAAVMLDPRSIPHGIDDSKRLTAPARERLAREIRRTALAYAVARVSAKEIDRIGIVPATIRAMLHALAQLRIHPKGILVDAVHLPIEGVRQRSLVHGDQRCLSIAAASILAKVDRDACMRRMDARYPGYGFAQHAGYPTQAHLRALRALGPSPIHRRSFAPVSDVLHSPRP